MDFALVVAVDKKGGIGKNTQLPWKLKGDLRYFSELTSGEIDQRGVFAGKGKFNVVMMGRKTWESLPEKHRPLKNRLNIVLSRNPEGLLLTEQSGDLAQACWENSLDGALKKLSLNKKIDQIFVIGGANVFEQAINHPECKKIYLTEVFAEFDCDTFFPKIPEDFRPKGTTLSMEENGLSYRFVLYERED